MYDILYDTRLNIIYFFDYRFGVQDRLSKMMYIYNDTKWMVFLCLLSSRCPSNYVYSSEQSVPSPAQSGGDTDPEVHKRTMEGALEQESTRHKVCPVHYTVYIYRHKKHSHFYTEVYFVHGVSHRLLITINQLHFQPRRV